MEAFKTNNLRSMCSKKYTREMNVPRSISVDEKTYVDLEN